MTTKPAYKRSRPNTLSFVNRTIGCLILSFFLMANASSLVYARKVVVKVGVYDNPPILYKTEAGKYKGLAIEILEYIASEEGWDIEYVSGTWSECLKKLENGEIDIQAYIAHSAKRAKKYSYTNETLFSNWGQVFKQPGSNIESILDLNQKTVVLLKNAIHNTAFRELIRKLPIECKIIEVDSNDLVLRFVGEMKADAGVVNRVFGDTQAKKYSIEKTSIIFDPIEIRYATPKGKNIILRQLLINTFQH